MRLTYTLVFLGMFILGPACKKKLDCGQINEIVANTEKHKSNLEKALHDRNKKAAEEHYDAVEKNYKKLGKIDEITCNGKVYKGSEEKQHGDAYLAKQKAEIDKL